MDDGINDNADTRVAVALAKAASQTQMLMLFGTQPDRRSVDLTPSIPGREADDQAQSSS